MSGERRQIQPMNSTNKKLLINCPNCGAPLTSDGYCTYCNTKVRYANEIEYNTFINNHRNITSILPTEIQMKFKTNDGSIFIIPFYGKPENIEIEYNSTDLIDHSGHTISRTYTSPTIRFEMVGQIIK